MSDENVNDAEAELLLEEHPFYLTVERIVHLSDKMTGAEKKALKKWEKNHVTGDGTYGTSNWPGWKQLIARLSH